MDAPLAFERPEKEILHDTKAFAIDDPARSWMHVAIAFSLLGASAWAALSCPWWALRVAASIVEGLTLVRIFILFHDYFHGAILRRSVAARLLFGAYGLIVLTPPRVWRETHNYHHAHNGKIVGSHVGAFPLVTVAMWKRMPRMQRFAYRAARHPATIAFGYFTVFAWGMCLAPLLRNPRRNASAAAALALQPLLAFAVVATRGWAAYVTAVFAPLALATAVGSYLFFAQHTFEGARFQPRESWSYVRAALGSSSYMPMGPIMRFFAGNIGYHHVHHLNPVIPFYRLPEAMDSIPELQSPHITRLTLHDVVTNFRLDVWDPERDVLVSRRDLAAS